MSNPAFSVLWRVVLHQLLNNIHVQNVFHFTNKELIPDEALDDYTAGLLDDFNTRIKTHWQEAQSNKVGWTKLTNTVVIPTFGPFAEFIYAASEQGLQEGNTIPAFCAAVMTKNTGLSGRRNRGRFYLCGLTEAAVFEEEIVDFEFLHLQTICGQLISNWGPFGSDQRNEIVLYSHKDGDVGGIATYAGVKKIVQVVPRRTCFTQRHRLLGRGP
jgi:hypothetical protein